MTELFEKMRIFVRKVSSKKTIMVWLFIWAVVSSGIIIQTTILPYGVKLYRNLTRSESYAERGDPSLSFELKYRNNGYNQGKSLIYNSRTKKKILTGIDWIAVSENDDSLILVAKDGKRGFVSRFSGHTVIPFRYDAAWSFGEGVAAVCEGDSIFFIDHSGQPINDKKFFRKPFYGRYIFHGKYAAIPIDDMYGLIDKKGEWVVLPEYSEIHIGPRNTWYVRKHDKWGVIDANGKFVVPLEYEYVSILNEGGIIVADATTHSQSRFDYDGMLVDKFVFEDVFEMSYYTNEFDENGNRKKVIDDMMKYSANNYYGLMTRKGVPVTSPLYRNIECVAPGIYKCRISDCESTCIMVNEEGDKISDWDVAH